MEEYIHFFQAEKRSIAERLSNYFVYSGLDTKIHYDEEKDVYILSVPANKEKEAKKYYQAFYFVERDRIEKGENDSTSSDDNTSLNNYDESNIIRGSSLEEVDLKAYEEEIASANMGILSSSSASNDDKTESDDISPIDSTSTIDGTSLIEGTASIDDDLSAPTGDKLGEQPDINSLEPDSTSVKSLLSDSGSYVMKSEKYKDYTGTQYIFLYLGIAGIIFVILNVAEVLTMLNGFFPNLIMGALFIFFISVAISTGKKAKQLKLEIDEETQQTDKINQWLQSTITKEFLASITNSELSEELDYIKKTETIRDMLINEFGEQLDKDYIDRLIEDYYSETFDTAGVYTERDIEVDTIKDIGNDI